MIIQGLDNYKLMSKDDDKFYRSLDKEMREENALSNEAEKDYYDDNEEELYKDFCQWYPVDMEHGALLEMQHECVALEQYLKYNESLEVEWQIKFLRKRFKEIQDFKMKES